MTLLSGEGDWGGSRSPTAAQVRMTDSGVGEGENIREKGILHSNTMSAVLNPDPCMRFSSAP